MSAGAVEGSYSLRWTSPIGDMLIQSTATHITRIDFDGTYSEGDTKSAVRASSNASAASGAALSDSKLPAVLKLCCTELDEYFTGKRKSFTVPIKPVSGTPFQLEVWNYLTNSLPFGTTTTYSAIGTAISRPKSVRAVGTANGANPISVIVPCHRVIGSDGKLHGYAGGLSRKKWLIAHENSYATAAQTNAKSDKS